MKNRLHKKTARAAFTLVEMLVVIAIIAILAGMITSTAVSVINKGKIKRVQGELTQIISAIDAYKGKKGFYPPDNSVSSTNLTSPTCGQYTPLYYELSGMTFYPSLNLYSNMIASDATNVTTANLQAYCGVAGIANSSTTAASDDAAAAETFLKDLAIKQVQADPDGTLANIRLLIAPGDDQNDNSFNPWHYNSSHPKYNTASYDLWAVVKIGSKTNLICNWNDSPIVVTSPNNLY